jgi:predicted nucleic acid-binding protein
MELVRGTRLGMEAKKRIDAAEACFTPAIVLAEVAHGLRRVGLGEAPVSRELTAIAEASLVVPIVPGLAMASSRATNVLRARARTQGLAPPGLADGLVLATARNTASRLLTGDRHFLGLAETFWLG